MSEKHLAIEDIRIEKNKHQYLCKHQQKEIANVQSLPKAVATQHTWLWPETHAGQTQLSDNNITS